MFDEKLKRITRELQRREQLKAGAWSFPVDPRMINKELFRKLCPEMTAQEIERAAGNGPLITHMNVEAVRRSVARIMAATQ